MLQNQLIHKWQSQRRLDRRKAWEHGGGGSHRLWQETSTWLVVCEEMETEGLLGRIQADRIISYGEWLLGSK